MNPIIYKTRDKCRKNLNKYTIQAFSVIPIIDKPLILDAGCGTGVSTLALIEMCNGIIYAVDTDQDSLNWFKEKVTALNLNDRINIIHDSIINPLLFHEKFDIILAEGLLNMTGFERGLPILIKNLKKDGYLLIHDEFKDDPEKRIFFENNNLKILSIFQLNEDVWWNDYYDYLEKRIKEINNNRLFKKELNEINEYKKNSKDFRSIYYVLQNKKNDNYS